MSGRSFPASPCNIRQALPMRRGPSTRLLRSPILRTRGPEAAVSIDRRMAGDWTLISGRLSGTDVQRSLRGAPGRALPTSVHGRPAVSCRRLVIAGSFEVPRRCTSSRGRPTPTPTSLPGTGSGGRSSPPSSTTGCSRPCWLPTTRRLLLDSEAHFTRLRRDRSHQGGCVRKLVAAFRVPAPKQG
jgi:hypothetical protein